MNPSRVAVRWLLILVLIAAASGRGAEVTDLIAAAEEAFDRWTQPFDFSLYRERLEAAISLWEEALPGIPEEDSAARQYVLNRLAQAHFELAEAYLVSRADREEAYRAGKEYALSSLRLDPVVRATEAERGFRAALRAASDVAAVFWYGNTLGQWLSYHQLVAIFGGVLDVLACYERAIEIDETYMGGGPHRSLAALIAQAHFVIGASRDDAVPHYERSIEIDPAYLESYVNYAEHYAGPTNRIPLRDELLATMADLAKDPQVVSAWPLYNELAIRRAERIRP